MVDEDSYWIKGLETTEAAGRRNFAPPQSIFFQVHANPNYIYAYLLNL